MSHVTGMNESCHRYELVMSVSTRHVTYGRSRQKERTKMRKTEKDRVVHLKDDRRSDEGRAHGVVDLLHRNHFTKGYLRT